MSFKLYTIKKILMYFILYKAIFLSINYISVYKNLNLNYVTYVFFKYTQNAVRFEFCLLNKTSQKLIRIEFKITFTLIRKGIEIPILSTFDL